ncbi:hypothetical protein REB14_03560 [Chryseobacterium sp. ES2]|uniref:D-isomer specific 2-hydroxyacid dehydrogenase catalytic domain-containing protein n=1 Tax=Chryseobacterium metallicongregator TaxID=3073042 RepID=A0ABU1E0T9_9FLAO|nr:hypothetical protein [Chryseobacterium sp. ES2]MDR4951262.1 hypothetical protein [Chryseobacterium sp. ES2]
MKVIVYHISQEDKKLLALANRKKHKITIIINPLSEATVHFAEAKDAVIIIDQENLVSNRLIFKLISFGIRYFIFRFQEQAPVDVSIIQDTGLKYITITDSTLNMSSIIKILDAWEKSD